MTEGQLSIILLPGNNNMVYSERSQGDLPLIFYHYSQRHWRKLQIKQYLGHIERLHT